MEDHVDAIFYGLSSEYDTFVLSTNAHSDDYSVEDIESLLLAQEARIEKNLKNLDFAGSSSVNLAAINVSNNPANKRRPGGFNGHPSSGGYHTQNYSPNFSGRGGGRAFNLQFSPGGRGNSVLLTLAEDVQVAEVKTKINANSLDVLDMLWCSVTT